MPDLSIIIQMAEFYAVDVKEILDGERKSENSDKELKEIIYVFLTIFLYLLKCPQSLIL